MAAPALALATAASAGGLKPGLYSLNGGLQEICLVAGGTWYSPTYAGWNGEWQILNNETHIFGNYAYGQYFGYANDSIVVKGHGGSWTDWFDDFSYSYTYDPIGFSLISKSCADTSGRHSDPSKTAAQRAQ